MFDFDMLGGKRDADTADIRDMIHGNQYLHLGWINKPKNLS